MYLDRRDNMAWEETGQGPKPKYTYWITDDGLTLINGWARMGLSDKQIANNMNINVSTLYEWKNRYPDIDEAVRKGKEIVDFEVENALLKRAMGYEVEETKTYMKDDGKGGKTRHVERTSKHLPSDATSMIFWLKNRQPDRWNDRKQVEHSGGMTNNVSMFQDISTDELKALAKDKDETDENEE